MQRRQTSLIRRFWVASLLLLPLLVGFSAAILQQAYSSSLDNAERDAMLAHIYALLAVTEMEAGQLSIPKTSTNPRFNMPESGLYARVHAKDGRLLWQSNSLELHQDTIPYTSSCATAGQTVDKHSIVESTHFRHLLFGTIWEVSWEASEDIGTTLQEQYLCFEVIQSQQAKQSELHAYRRALAFWLGGMTILLIIIQVAVVKWSLRPLDQAQREIHRIQSGQQQVLSDNYPVEIAPVTESINTLITTQNRQRERYKNSLSDLAHSLKTPLSVIRALLSKQQTVSTSRDAIVQVDEQVERMSTIIAHQLRRANTEVKTLFNEETPILPIVERLTHALEKVYANKHIDFEINIRQDTTCIIHADDLMELLGNIMDNACKYGQSLVRVSAQHAQDHIQITIEDNGPGVSQALKTQILGRGARADTAKLGQGIGLAMTVDILSSYNSSLSIEGSSAGGAVFQIRIPQTMG